MSAESFSLLLLNSFPSFLFCLSMGVRELLHSGFGGIFFCTEVIINASWSLSHRKKMEDSLFSMDPLIRPGFSLSFPRLLTGAVSHNLVFPTV